MLVSLRDIYNIIVMPKATCILKFALCSLNYHTSIFQRGDRWGAFFYAGREVE
jgi:hypothetical protein